GMCALPPSPLNAFFAAYSPIAGPRGEPGGDSVLLVAWLPGLHQLLLHLCRNRFVVTEIQRVTPASGGDGLEFGGVAFQLRQRHLRLHHDVPAAHRIGAADARPLGGETAADVAHVLFGRRHFQVHDRLEYLRPGPGNSVQEGLLAGRDEGDLLAVDAVVLAVVDGHAHVLQRVSGDGAAGHHLAHALLHDGDELARDDAALDLVGELEAGAARQRFDAQEHLAGLAGAAGLLLVAVVPLGLAGDGFAIGDARWPGLDLDSVPVFQPSQHDPQVEVGQAAQHGLVELGVVLDRERRILLGQLVQGGRQLLLLALARRLHRQPEHRPWEGQRRQVEVVVLVAVVQHRVEVQVVDLGHGGDVAGNGLVDLDVVLALQPEQVRDLERLAPVADEQLRVPAYRALVDAEHAHLAHERVVGDAEDVGDHVRRR